ncbi:MAG TPA: helix-turn-helix domain-containing protein, partial [Trebonia sp.]|nr:helix-turn-helix domain-containing protein [Trebonia sp.]
MGGSARSRSAFGVLLRRHREAAGLTQEDLAERSGLSVRAISDLERGRTKRPYPGSVQSLARALELDDQAADEFRRAARAKVSTVSPVPPDAPRQLPAAPRDFAGRAVEAGTLDRLLDAAAGGVMISVIGGMAGVGKTALAVQWAHRVAGRFPDGQLYVNLRGFDPSGSPIPPDQAIRGFLGALGIPAERIPADLDAAASLYRTVLAGKRVLIVLDNARDERQVRPLIPGGRGCLVVVTSRNDL